MAQDPKDPAKTAIDPKPAEVVGTDPKPAPKTDPKTNTKPTPAAKKAGAGKKDPAPAKKDAASGLAVVVVGPKAGRRRIGRSFGAEPVSIPLEDLSEDDKAALIADPHLSVSAQPAD